MGEDFRVFHILLVGIAILRRWFGHPALLVWEKSCYRSMAALTVAKIYSQIRHSIKLK
jgi:hypothetical protein